MKQVYFIIAMLCGLALGGQAQGIRFAEGSWKELLETAKKEGKLIFVDCYTEWCQPCKQMEQQVFPSKKVGKFYNEHFINVKMDMEKGEGPVILNTYKINAFPTLLFVNGEGGEVYRIVGSKKEAELLQVGADALASGLVVRRFLIWANWKRNFTVRKSVLSVFPVIRIYRPGRRNSEPTGWEGFN